MEGGGGEWREEVEREEEGGGEEWRGEVGN